MDIPWEIPTPKKATIIGLYIIKMLIFLIFLKKRKVYQAFWGSPISVSGAMKSNRIRENNMPN